MDRTPPPPLGALTRPRSPEADADVLALCEEHLTREESLLTDLLRSLRQVRDSFSRRDLSVLSVLHARQRQLRQSNDDIAADRDRLREELARRLGVSAAEATLRRAALALGEPARGRLLDRHARVLSLVRQAEQLGRHNAALVGYARGFFDCLFAGLSGASGGDRYGPHGLRQRVSYGPFLQARG